MIRVHRAALVFVTIAPAAASGACGRSSKPDPPHSVISAAETSRAAAPKTPSVPPVSNQPPDSTVGGAPWVTPSDTGPVLHLPPAMARALADSFPRFAPWPWGSYPEHVRREHLRDTTASVRWVIGDFDGDGKLDVAIDGNVDTTKYRDGGRNAPTIVAIMSRGDTVVVVQVTNGALVAGGDVSARLRESWLVPVPRGTFRKLIVNDAIGVPDTDRFRELLPGQVYLWYEHHFVQWSDGE